MIRALLSNGMFVLGIDAENIRRLKAGQPIVVCLAELGGKNDVVIVYGETRQAILRILEEANGGPLPNAIPLGAARKMQ